jgi:hypothetical protein
MQQLAKYGFVEQVAGKDHRERPWRLVATSYDWKEANATAAVDMLDQTLAEGVLDNFLAWQQQRKNWPQPWREPTGRHSSTVYLTQAETAGLGEAIDALLLRYVNERPIDDVASRPPGSVPVDFTLFVLPAIADAPPSTDAPPEED